MIRVFVETGLWRSIGSSGLSEEVCAACGYVRGTHLKTDECNIMRIGRFIYMDDWLFTLKAFEYAYFKHHQLRCWSEI